MKAIADALVYATTYINLRDDLSEEYLDDDVGALESIAGFLHSATEEERNELAAAAKRALAVELSSPKPRAQFVEDLAVWMESMFGEDWAGNNKA